ncbi:MAG: hypothetical protein EHM35_01465 [Planctomycetaceae bacterium]|nr:MAG: hypothetical protein EHM35_01465 [Planctomycetaceae bacterium]
MAVNDAGSGPQDNAGSNKDSALDRAIAAAMGGASQAEFEDGDVPLPDPRKRPDEKPIAGDESEPEDTRAPDKKVEAKDGKAAPAEGEPKPIEAPKHWPEELRKEFGTLGPKEQALLLKRDKDLQGIVTRKSQELSDTARFGTAVRELINGETRQRMAAMRLDDLGYFRYLDGLQNAAVNRPVEYVAWVMRQLQVTPEHLGLTARGQQQQAHVDPSQQIDESLLDPAVRQLRDYVAQQNTVVRNLQARLEAQDRAAREWETQQQTTARSTLDGMWQTFRSQLDDSGQLAHPNADSLMAQMGALMETNRSLMNMPDGPEKLVKAYQMAEAADPDLSKPRIEAEVARRLAEAEKKRETERARKATSVRPASGAPAVPKRAKAGLDGALEAAFEQLGNRT